MRPTVLTVGESAVVLDPTDDAGAEVGARFQLRVSGAESNFGIALARLGIGVTWISRLGLGPIGDLIARTLASEGIDLRYLVRVDGEPTAMTVKLRRRGTTSLVYYRRNSAASRMRPADVPAEAFNNVRMVHLTGITQALGPGPRRLVESVARRARQNRCVTTFDLNYRPALWTTDEAAEAARRVLPMVDWVLCGEDEARLLFGGTGRKAVIDRLERAGAKQVVLRVGSDGAMVASDGALTHVKAMRLDRVVDDIGAGDAFDAGFVFGLAKGLAPAQSARIGTVLAAQALSGTGDWETMPNLEGLRRLVPDLDLATDA